MRKKKITYGINGLMTYQAVFMSGKTKVKVMFTDGSITATGKRPATFTTDNLMMQHIIENSEDFKKGFIFRYRNLVLNEEVELEKNPPRSVCEEGNCCGHPHSHHNHWHREKEADIEICEEEGTILSSAGAEDPWEKKEDKPLSGTVQELSSSNGIEACNENEEVIIEDEDSEEEEMSVMVFSFNDQAKDYLEENFGIDRNRIKTRAEIIKAGAENGVIIEFDR